nr:Gfo/Idh/MocA family oxidoreductase [Cohnella zeiphila]
MKFGIIGTNWITDSFIRAGRKVDGFELAAVYSRTERTASEFAAKHGVRHTFTDLERMAASGEIDAVYIASPNSLHAEHAIACLRKGVHVLCEKPLASNAAEVARMLEASEQSGSALMEAMKSTLLPNFAAIRASLPKIGKIRRYFASYCQYSSRYDAFRKGTVLNAFNPAFSNGALMDLGVYCLYPAIVLFGKPRSVKAGGMLLSSGADGEGSMLLEYDGMEGVIQYSKISDSSLPSEIQGEDGTIVIDRISQPQRVEIRYRDGRIEDASVGQDDETMKYEIEEFIRLVKRGRRESETNSHANSLAAMEAVDAARRQIGLRYPADDR